MIQYPCKSLGPKDITPPEFLSPFLSGEPTFEQQRPFSFSAPSKPSVSFSANNPDCEISAGDFSEPLLAKKPSGDVSVHVGNLPIQRRQFPHATVPSPPVFVRNSRPFTSAAPSSFQAGDHRFSFQRAVAALLFSIGGRFRAAGLVFLHHCRPRPRSNKFRRFFLSRAITAVSVPFTACRRREFHSHVPRSASEQQRHPRRPSFSGPTISGRPSSPVRE
ncbi:TonB-dependent receptor [Striga asiatica]|uniref:TonB-dependent receptor n=1 Tax=Striga asiatica TaxID=4170 RepID=A0A5A7QL49_STRAF|nr:TonB-dependent receptor [Striga asiatica]